MPDEFNELLFTELSEFKPDEPHLNIHFNVSVTSQMFVLACFNNPLALAVIHLIAFIIVYLIYFEIFKTLSFVFRDFQ